MGYDPVVFISSTSEDLEEHREMAAQAALAIGFSPRYMKYFPASGHLPSLPACLQKVDEAEVVVVLVAHRYGWVPDDASNPDHKSITWLECHHARHANNGKEVLAFLVDEKYAWPAELKESYRLVLAKDLPDEEYDQIRKEVRRNEKKLAEFKRELSGYFRASFTNAASVRPLVSEALAVWRERHRPATVASAPLDPETYLKALEDRTRQIRITGLSTKRAEPYVFRIDEIYIPLTTPAGQDVPRQPDARGGDGKEQERRIVLEQTLTQRRVVLVGDPGSGKSTFLRRTAFELCRALRGTRPPDAPPFLPVDDRRFPILIAVSDFAKLLEAEKLPKPAHSPDWIPYFLGRQSEEYRWGIGEAFFRSKLDQGGCLLMVDGLDEAPNRRMRERIVRIFEEAAGSYPRADFLVTTRPQTNVGDAVLDPAFHPIQIGALQRPEIDVFFDHFARALAFPEAEAGNFKKSLETALDSRPEIADMATNPVMLTALAVLQHNDQRLPEYRVDLYGSILGWLAQARKGQPDRHTPEKCLEYMRKLALHMQDAASGRLTQIGQRPAAEFLSKEFDGSVETNEELLERETQDSGIVSAVGGDLKFWHLSFQEYLAARELVSLSDADLFKMVVAHGKLFRGEWRETMRLLGGLLYKQGAGKIAEFVRVLLDSLGDRPTLAQRVDCIALLSAMMQDLSRMGYSPKTADFKPTVLGIQEIFQAGAPEDIDIGKRAEAADLLGQVGDPRLKQDNWVTIPAHPFLMGAQKENEKEPNYDPEAWDEESPVHEVSLLAFRMQRYPVTVQEFGEFVADGGAEPEDWERQKQYPNRPVVGVSWFEAAAYCSWKGGRLPSEAEWERAVRGPQGTRYPWGDQPALDSSRANYEMSVGRPTPVGLYPKGNTAEGLCDMLGNVWEWCEDWFGPYQADGPRDQKYKVVRGGSWNDISRYVRASIRLWFVPSNRSVDVGFRCAGEFR
ncbi:MAG: SUMF1/EgtB/PvdO family nonheme iron enzyme, partial [Bryobacteraceae bacterium]